jgi:DNA invertase Pin-like site-specific DNA recombinase
MKIEFRCWQQRLAAAFGTLPKVIMYTRKSTEAADRQIRSHDQQIAEIIKKFRVTIPSAWHWMDNMSGTTFHRPSFQDMLSFAQENPRPKEDPGVIYLFDPSRFGRTLDVNGKPDVLAFLATYSAFENAGWQLHFVTMHRTGELLADVMMLVVHAFSAAQYSATLSTNVIRGRVDHASRGYWTAGRAPFGALRAVEGSGEVLGPGVRKTPGGGGIVLKADPAVIPIWEQAARLVIGGAALGKVGALLFAQGVRGPSKRRGKLGHKSIRNLLTNPALAGRLVYRGNQTDAKGKRRMEDIKARWGPLVDMALFNQVAEELAHRGQSPRNRTRKKREHYPLSVTCAACGGEYTGGRLSKAQGEPRVYSHTKPVVRMRPDVAETFHKKGCKVWTVSAEEIETKIRDLIAGQRTAPEFEAEIKRLILERDNFRKRADEAVGAARLKLEKCQLEYGNLARTVRLVGVDHDDERDPLVKELVAAKACVDTARREVQEAERFARSKDEVWAEVSRIIADSRNIASAWDQATPEQRTTLIRYWVLHIMIVVQRIPGMKRANRKTAIVTLRTVPNAPQYFVLDGQVPTRASAEAISDTTHGSDSIAPLARSASSAPGEEISPSAQAACPRTSGSSSDSASASEGTSSALPTLPSTTAALRRKPRRFARFMGDPLKDAENSSCVIASSSSANDRASLPATAARGAYGDLAASSFENLRLNGHTS